MWKGDVKSLANHVLKERMLDYQCPVAPVTLEAPFRVVGRELLRFDRVYFEDLVHGIAEVLNLPTLGCPALELRRSKHGSKTSNATDSGENMLIKGGFFIVSGRCAVTA